MVLVIHDCKCSTCLGSFQPKHPKGEIVFGGTLCNCYCHTLTGTERSEFIQLKEKWVNKK